MKAFIAFIVLAMTLIMPAAQALMPEPEVSVFIVDEEKGNDSKKLFSPTEEHLPTFPHLEFVETLMVDLGSISQLPVDRAVEFTTPPPDFC